jgi:hypothetical protein
VRRWLRRARAETALGWGQAGFLERLRQRAAEEAKAAQASTPAVEPRHTFPQWLRDMAIICAVVFGVLGLAGLIVSTATNTARAAVKESRLDYYPVWW